MHVGQSRVRQREAGSGARSGGPKEETAPEWDRDSVLSVSRGQIEGQRSRAKGAWARSAQRCRRVAVIGQSTG